MTAPATAPPRPNLSIRWSVVLLVAVGSIAVVTARIVPALSAVVVALLLGLLLANFSRGRLTMHSKVSAFMTKRVLKVAVILVGAGFNLALLGEVGLPLVTVVLAVVMVAFAVATLVGRAVRLGTRPSLLIAVGTAICGVSAIAALAPLIKAKQDEIAIAVATIVTFNAVALLAYPLIATLSGMDPFAYGMWAGASIHDAASAIGAGFALGPEAGEAATLTKLTRVLFLLPVLAITAGVVAGRSLRTRDRAVSPWRQIGSTFPWFVVGFAAMAFVATQGWLGPAAPILSEAARILIVFVIAAIALGLQFSTLLRTGKTAIIVGLVTSVAVSAVAAVVVLWFAAPA